MKGHNDAVADLAEAVGQALVAFAEQLRSPDAAIATAPPLVDQPAHGGAAQRVTLGPSQTSVLNALKDAGPTGLTAKQAAEAVGLKATNTSTILAKLAHHGVAVVVAERPLVWRAMNLPDVPTASSA